MEIVGAIEKTYKIIIALIFCALFIFCAIIVNEYNEIAGEITAQIHQPKPKKIIRLKGLREKWLERKKK